MLDKFPPTLTISTPSGGYHLYYEYHPGLTVSANAYPEYPNVDIRSDSGYVVAPPSQTPKGEYIVQKKLPIAPFPHHLFPKTTPRKSLTDMTTARKGNRDDSLTSLAGLLLKSEDESKWESEALPALERVNKTYNPPLPPKEVKKIFDSISKKERESRAELIVSPFQLEDGTNTGPIKIPLRKSSSNVPYKDMANALLVLEHHPYFKDNIRFNTFKQVIEYKGRPIEDSDVIAIQYFMQTQIKLNGINERTVFTAIIHYAQENKYDEAQEWLKSLTWDQTPRLHSWLSTATGVPNDTYHSSIGAQWFKGMISRIMKPGSIFYSF